MNQILEKTHLNENVACMVIYAPLIAAKAEPGQFVILRVREEGERIPLTVADFDRELGTVTIIYQIVGATTRLLDQLEKGDEILDFVGPLGRATVTEGLQRVAVIGGGVGCAIAYPVVKKLHNQGTWVDTVIGFRSSGLAILDDEFSADSSRLFRVSDDGTYGEKGLVTDILRRLLENGEQYDEVIAIGPLPMMKYVSLLTKQFGIKTIVSMNPIMIDGTGMCGCCRLTVGGKMRFACIDGPDFDGHEVDFDEAIARSSAYRAQERLADEHICNLLKGGC